jgi:NTP pyrophosphatase (non-canonical NTP hydrolase)
MGVAGEAGEVVDELKKALFQGHTLQTQKIIEEIGDVLWYCALTCDAVGVDLEYAAKKNIQKLKERYPEGFRETDSINRKK